jgi:hypothetical protein
MTDEKKIAETLRPNIIKRVHDLIFNNSHTTGATNRAGITCTSGEPEFTSGFLLLLSL